MIDLRQLQNELYVEIKEKGFMLDTVPVPEQCALIHSEVSEALESYRNNEPISWTDNNGKPQGIASEYIDVLIRVLNYCSHLNIDVEMELKRKREYNKKRSFKHRNKLI